MKQAELQLSTSDRVVLDGFRRKGVHPAAALLLERVAFHYTPKHASWLNMAEIEIGIMDRQCTGRRIASAELLEAEVGQWQQQRNAAGRGIEWKFTRQDADRKLHRHYVP